MTGQLDVHLYGEHCGVLTPGTDRTYTFAYTGGWRDAGGPAISLALPIGAASTDQQRSRAWFGGLLPEGAARRHIAQETGVDELDDLALLELLGRECAGAVTITREGTPALFAPEASFIRWLDPGTLRELLESMRIPGEHAALDHYSVSLAGAQRKRGLVVDADRVGVPEGNDLSTHILKLEPPAYPGLTENEHCIQGLAADVGLRAATTSVREVGEVRALQIERYDRHVESDGSTSRLHQEDMCQALGRLSSHKYERFDGTRAIGPTIADMVALVRGTARPSVQQVDDLLRAVWFNVIVGNVDAHAKNYSVLYSRDLATYAIAPLYDSICVTAYVAGRDMATRRAEEPLSMNIGGVTRFWQLTRDDIVAHARSLSIQPRWLLRQLATLIDRVDAAVDARIDTSLADPVTAHDIVAASRDEIHRRCAFLHALVG